MVAVMPASIDNSGSLQLTDLTIYGAYFEPTVEILPSRTKGQYFTPLKTKLPSSTPYKHGWISWIEYEKNRVQKSVRPCFYCHREFSPLSLFTMAIAY
jgi:hypothetical protein